MFTPISHICLVDSSSIYVIDIIHFTLVSELNLILVFFSFFREIQEDECLRQAYRRLGIEQPTRIIHAMDLLKDII